MPTINPIIFEIKEIIFLLHHKGEEVTLAWIPSHMGIPGNKKADSLEKLATSNGIAMETLLTYTDLKLLDMQATSKPLPRFFADIQTSLLHAKLL